MRDSSDDSGSYKYGYVHGDATEGTCNTDMFIWIIGNDE